MDSQDPGGRTPIVGLGASAGGLEAFREFIEATPPDSGAAFVLIQHLDPTHESLTAELLTRHTLMPVSQVTADTAVEPNHVYVIPPNRYMAVRDGRLVLTAPSAGPGPHMSVDHFFRSLAEVIGRRAVGVVLSGTGSDGSQGIKEIKAAGGMAIVQDPQTAQFDGMPRSAVATGSADVVAPIASIPGHILEFLKHSYVTREPAPDAAAPDDDVRSMISLLRARVKYDFSPYKRGTLRRRMQRRMGLKHVERPQEYLEILRRDPHEAEALFKDLLIGVTSFFRDPEAWEVLERDVLPRIVRDKPDGEPIRVWSAGCSSGEEAYSAAMLLIEQMDRQEKHCPIQVFASDVDPDALETGRVGTYPEGISADVPAARLRRFFTKEPHAYRIRKELRESIVFASHNLLSDPPFSRMDLITCRNLLIYLEPQTQRHVLALLHFALNEGAFLFLGSAGSVSGQDDLFETVSKPWRIYRRLGPTRHDLVQFPVAPAARTVERAEAAPAAPAPRDARLSAVAQRLLLERFAPPCVVINRKYEVIYYTGPTGRFLTHPSGPPTNDLLALVRDGLRSKLRGAIRRAIEQSGPVAVAAAVPRRDGEASQGWVSVEPLTGPSADGLLLVVFHDGPRGRAAPADAAEPAGADAPAQTPVEPDDSLVHQLEFELKATREDLQSTIEELETSNEELRASNEEVMSVNEELQSTNEELETSREELQSLNEELNTLNNQLEAKITELEGLNNDLSNLFASTNLATVFLDRDLKIRRFTPAVTRLVRLIPSDVGRPIIDFAHPYFADDLARACERVLESLAPIESELRDERGRWHLRRILPYRTQEDRIDGVVVTFQDITALKNAQAVLEAANERLERAVADRTAQLARSEQRMSLAVRATRDAVWDVDLQTNSVWFNDAFADLFGRPRAPDQFWRWRAEAMHPEDRDDAERSIRAAIEGDADRWEGEYRVKRRDGEYLFIQDRAYIARDEDGRPVRALGSMRDLTAHKRAEADRAMIAAAVEASDEAIVRTSPDGVIETWNAGAKQIYGYEPEQIIGRHDTVLVPIDRRADLAMIAEAAAAGRPVRELRTKRLTKDGEQIDVSLTASAIRDERGALIGVIQISRDMSEIKRAEDRLRESERLVSVGTLAAGIGHDMSNMLMPMRLRLDELMRQGLPEQVSGALSDIGKGMDYLADLCSGLRQLVRDTDGARTGFTRIQTWWSHIVPLLKTGLPDGVELLAEIDDDLPPVTLPAHMLTKVVLNLVVNAGEAIEGADRTAGRIVVAANRAEAPDLVGLTVTDDGPGMTERVRKRMFDPFFTTKTRGQTTGMGMSLVQGIVEAAGGSIGVESSPGRGTKVTLKLPIASARAESGKAARPIGVVTVADPRVSAYTSALLTSAGFEVRIEPPEDSERIGLWITDPTDHWRDLANRYTHNRRVDKIVVVGEASDAWMRLGAEAVDTGTGLARLQELVSSAKNRDEGEDP